MERFYWVIEGLLAGCSLPGGQASPRTSDSADDGRLLHDLRWLRRQDIGAVISMTESALPADALHRHEMAYLHLPVPDLTAPVPTQFDSALTFIDRQHANGHAVAVHCLAGQGRSGTVLAAYLIRGGMNGEQAVARMRQICPGAIGTESQERALDSFARRRDWFL